ncbi:MAG: hypothetical protein GXO26_07070 [Crenarchaeota archaeon]|nr:hypothetical protein [Thermoproteota archaeon]
MSVDVFPRRSEGISNQLEEISREFVARCGNEIEGLVITRADGLVIYAYKVREQRMDERAISAMVTAAVGSSRRIFRQLKNGNVSLILIEGDSGKLIIRPISIDGREIFIGVLTPSEANLGLIFLELDRYASRVREILR